MRSDQDAKSRRIAAPGPGHVHHDRGMPVLPALASTARSCSAVATSISGGAVTTGTPLIIKADLMPGTRAHLPHGTNVAPGNHVGLRTCEQLNLEPRAGWLDNRGADFTARHRGRPARELGTPRPPANNGCGFMRLIRDMGPPESRLPFRRSAVDSCGPGNSPGNER